MRDTMPPLPEGIFRNEMKKFYDRIKNNPKFSEREYNAKWIIRKLCTAYDLPECDVHIYDEEYIKVSKLFGILSETHMAEYDSETHEIRIWNKDRDTHQDLNPDNFFESIVHEFVHHFDLYYFGTLKHDKSFYNRMHYLMHTIKNGNTKNN